MGTDHGTRWDSPDAWDRRYGPDEYGPPSELDLAWYIHHVVARDYPRLVQKAELPGQTDIYEQLEEACQRQMDEDARWHDSYRE